jgi:hypothetical protein
MNTGIPQAPLREEIRRAAPIQRRSSFSAAALDRATRDGVKSVVMWFPDSVPK